MDSESNITIHSNKKNRSIIVAIISALVIIAAIVIIIIVLNNNTINDSYFVSDDSKLVINLKNNPSEDDLYTPQESHLVYYYSGNDITGFKAFYKYSNANAAKTAYDFYYNNGENYYEKIETNGNYVVITTKESDYSSLTAEDVRQQIEYLNAVNSTTEDTTTETGKQDENTDSLPVDTQPIIDEENTVIEAEIAPEEPTE